VRVNSAEPLLQPPDEMVLRQRQITHCLDHFGIVRLML
jgi:hypothetical protein